MDNPFITILIPSRNEELFIEDCLRSVLSDRTREIVNRYVKDYPFVRIVENPGMIYPCAINLGVKESKGEIIVILGAHAIYGKGYISDCVKYLNELNADNVGGVLNTVGLNTSFAGRAITNVLSSSFGVGNSTFRVGADKVMEVDTVFGGCYRRDVFDRIGFFNENLVSTSDMDFNTRLKRAGGKIFLIPEIEATYYTRSSFGSFMKNNFRNGYWAIYPIRFLDYIPVRLRHFIPLLFFGGIIVGIALSFVSPIFLYILLGTLFLYFSAAVFSSLKYFDGKDLSFVLMPLFFPLLHLSYGFGSMVAAVKVLFAKLFRRSQLKKV